MFGRIVPIPPRTRIGRWPYANPDGVPADQPETRAGDGRIMMKGNVSSRSAAPKMCKAGHAVFRRRQLHVTVGNKVPPHGLLGRQMHVGRNPREGAPCLDVTF